MSIITIHHKKLRFLFLAFVGLLLVVSISFGTIGSSASSIINQENKEEKSSATDLRNKEFSFLTDRISTFFNGNDNGQTVKNGNFAAGLSYAALEPASTFVVNSNGDSNDAIPGNGVCLDSTGSCTLRAAIQEANATTGTDVITFSFTTPSTIQLNSSFSPGGLLVTEAVNITGPDARALTVTGNSNTVSGVFKISYAAAVSTSISGISVINSQGHGINNEARLNLTDVTVKGNGYGIYNTGRLNLNRLTISNNTSGGIYIGGASIVNISNTTISNNTSADHGGGIYSLSSDVTLNNVTISNNTAATSGGGMYYSGQSPGVYIRNTIIANNTAPAATGPDVYAFNGAAGAVFTSRGNNLIGKSGANTGFVHAVNGDKVGTVAVPINPLLGALQNNGGQTDTRALLTGSPAKDAGNVCVTNSNCNGINPPTALLLTDQRGNDFPRNYESGVDIGAFELFYPTPVINTLSPSNWGKGKGAFELTINGSNFAVDSVVKWNGQTKPTTFVSNSQVKAQISASDVAANGQFPITVTNPQPGGGISEPVNFTVADCSFSLNPTSQTVQAAGGSFSTTVNGINGCGWTAVSNDSWITVTTGSSGTGNGTVTFTVAANPGSPRNGTITIGGQTFTVNQVNGCAYNLSSSSVNLSGAAGAGSFIVQTNGTCEWTAVSNDSWITITGGSTGTGSGPVSFTVTANGSGQSRTGTITVAGKTFTVTQAGACTFSINPANQNFASAGGTGNFSVTAGTGCNWTAVSSAAWITISSGASGTGNGTVNFSIAANTGGSRNGSITVGGQTFTITQDTGCTYTLSPTGANIAAGGVTSSFTVSSGTGCTWTAVSNASWITVTSGASGNGNGTVQYTVATNTGVARTGTITVNGQTFTVNQAAPCTFSITPSNQSFPAAGGSSNFNVTTAAGCSWTATASQPWITITSGASGSGSGMVSFSIAANTGTSRNGSITVGGQTFTIVQEASCSYTLSATTANAAAGGGSGSVNVTSSNSGCAWTATSNAAWITVTGGASGNGNGTVQYAVAANTGPDRSGTITIAGQVFTINQASGCSYVLSPTSANPTAAGGTGNFSVASGVGCAWTAVSNVPWITVTNGSAGTGNGTVQYTVAANTGVERTGTITVNGQTFNVTQANGCTYSLNPSSQSFSAAAANSSFAVNTNSTCSWTAVSSVTWVTVTNSAGTGNGTVTFTVAANTGSARTGTITVNGQIFNISQESGCTITISSAGTSFQNSGGTGSFNVTTSNPGCTWSAVTTFPWITINNGTGTGNGTVTFTVAANVSPQRTGTITVGGQTFTINQADGCAYALSSTSATAPAGGVTASFNINSGAGCAWTAVSNDSWITINNPSGTGSGTISYTVAANIGPQRIGTITVNGQTFTITQFNGCQFTLSATSATSPIAGGTGSVNVTSINGCAWTAASNAPWITVTGGASGNGNGTVQYTVAANTGPPRSGTITIAGHTFTISQDNGCTYTLSSTSTNINEAGGVRSFNISSGIGCTWTAVSNDSWITITSGASGSGNGIIEFSVQANTGVDRTGTITVAGQTFTVNQVTLTVKNLNDSGAGSLRQAVINANNMPGNDVITFQQSLAGTITLTSGEIPISDNGSLEIRGLKADVLFISGNNASRIFYIDKATVKISDLTLMKGNGVGAGSTETNKRGGAIYANQGTLTLRNVHVMENILTVPNIPGSNSNGNGGGLYLLGGLNHLIQNSTFSSNRSTYGAGFFSQNCQIIVENSTFSFNAAEKIGGGIQSVGDTTLRNVTITNNSSDGTAKSGGGIISEGGKLNIGNTIIAGNTGPEITYSSGVFLSAGNNLIGDAPGDAANTDSPLTYQPSDIRDTSPMFSPLGLYGGAIPTEALMVGSPAINAGNNANAPALLQTDQRGSPRIMEGKIDIGAFEYNIAFTPSASALPNADIGAWYSQTIRAKRFDFTDPLEEFIYRITDGYLPPGMQLSQEGHLYGYPETAGSYTFTIKAVATNFMAGVNKYTLSVGCNYTINPPSQSISAAGENGSVNLTTAAGCTWTAISNAPWITVTNNTSNPRVGNGAVAFAVQPNTGAARTGTITIGGQTFTVNQASGACSYTLSSTSANVSGSGGTGNFSVNSAANCTWTAVSNASWISITNGSSGTGNATVNFSTQANSGVQRTGTITAGGQTFTVNQGAGTVAPGRSQFDFDGDNKTDLSIFRPGPGEWWYLKSSNGGNGAFQFGSNTDKLVPADFTGDGKSDFAFFRPSSGEWFILRSEDFSFYSFPFGASSDIPVPADYDGDGKADAAVFRPSTQTWFINRSSGGTTIQQFGASGDVPAIADYDGDGKADIAIYRPSLGQWWLSRSSAGVIAFQFGASTDKPVQGDYTGDGRADVAFFRPSSGEWFILRSEDNSFYAFPFGANGDIPSPGDYDGDGKADAAVFRPLNNTWFVQMTTAGTMIQSFGQTGDKSVPSAYVH